MWNIKGCFLKTPQAPHQAAPSQVLQPSSPSCPAPASANWIIGSDESFIHEPRDPGAAWSPQWCPKDQICSVTVTEVLLHCFDSGCSVSHTVSAPCFVLTKTRAGVLRGRWLSFLLSWSWQSDCFCVCVSRVASCLRLARTTSPHKPPRPILCCHSELRPPLLSCAGMHYLPCCMPSWTLSYSAGVWLSTCTCALSAQYDNMFYLCFWRHVLFLKIRTRLKISFFMLSEEHLTLFY